MSKRRIVLVDIDGTISKISEERLHCIKNVDWDTFYGMSFDDEPIIEMVDLIQKLSEVYDIIFCTGRSEVVRGKTQMWLKKHFTSHVPYCELLMRKVDDHRADTIIKPELLEEANIKLSDIEFILEDRTRLVDMWRSKGIRCLQVAPGNF